MELALWADCRVMAQDAYMGVYCRRWGVPLIDGGTVRLPRIVGQGRALEIIMTGRKVEAEEWLRIGLCEKVVPKGQARKAAEEMAQKIARFPQACVRADRHSTYLQQGLTTSAALEQEWVNSIGVVELEGVAGAGRFAKGAGRRPGALLLRAQELLDAEHWIASHPRGAPEPTDTQRQFIAQSRRGAV